MSISMAAAQQGAVNAGAVDASTILAEVESLGARIGRVRAAIGRVIFGQDEVVDQTLITLLSAGHVLLVGVPGLGKSRLVETLGIGELVTIDEANYVERAVRLCRDSAWNAQIRERISRARTAMYDDARPVRALEAFLERVTRGEPVSSAWPM